MSEIEKKQLLDKLNLEKLFAFSDITPNAPVISEIVSQLNSIDKEDKYFFSEFATSLKNELFIKGITIRGFNLDSFQKEINLISERNQNVTAKIKEDQVQVKFLELYKKLVDTLSEHLNVHKGYFILRLENDPLKSYKLLILYDKSFIMGLVKKQLSKSINCCVFNSLPEFIQDIKSGNFGDSNYLCLLLLMPRINDSDSTEKLIENLKVLLDNYSLFENISPKLKGEVIQNDYHRYSDREDFLDEILYVNSTMLSNGSFKHEEEKIVKKLSTHFKTPLILYKTLKKGNSGATVIEIRPKKEFGEQYEKKYIIKYAEIDIERKIKKEKENFDFYIRGYKGFNDYECHYCKTLTHEGIIYGYAIADSEKESFSFCDIIGQSKNPFYSQKIDLVDKLFKELPLFEIWRNSIEQKKIKVSDLYCDYINEDKIFLELMLILDINSDQLTRNELVINFKKIWHFEDTFNIKICHGDLHTDNFFVDKKGIYLIDFGFTGKKHSLIDHTSLECSLKFKHFPNYVGIEVLKDLEDELILDNSFNLSKKFASTSRRDITETLEIIKGIRVNSRSLSVDSNSTTEYLISLFIMTFRQIRYKDLNQIYAYNSALILSKKIIQLIGNERFVSSNDIHPSLVNPFLSFKEISKLNEISKGKYVITKRSNGEYQFNLNATNGQVILTSEGYIEKSSCENGIASVRKNSSDDSRYVRKTSTNGKYYFSLMSSNGQILGSSEMYQSPSGRDNGIESVKLNGQSEITDDQTV